MKTVKSFTADFSSHNTDFLLKYHPKYYSELHLTTSDIQKRRIFTKIKAIKVVKSLEIPYYETHIRSLVLSGLRSQRKSLKNLSMKDPALVKHFPRVEAYILCSKMPDSWRVFLQLLHLKTLTLEYLSLKVSNDSRLSKELGEIRSFSWRFWQHYENLKALENFHVYLYNRINSDTLEFLAKLNSMKEELSSLRIFSLFLSHIGAIADTDLNFENLYNHLTAFRINESSFKTIQKFLINVNSFQKLESLNILKNLSYPEDDLCAVDFSYFKCFSQLNQIKTMDILINFGSRPNFLNFLEHFSLPKSIISLKLSFYESDWSALVPKNQLNNLKDINAFESHPLCLNFYNKWQDLKNLESLPFCFCERDSNGNSSLYFTTPILKRLTTLKSLYFANWLNDFSNSPQSSSGGKIKALNFYHLWKSLQNMKPTLKKLFIDSPAISLRKFPSSSRLEDQEKLELQELGICGLVLGDLYLEVLSQSLVRNDENHCSKMEIESVIIDNKESMMEVIDILANIPKRINASMSFDVRRVEPAGFMEMITKDFVRVMKKPHIKIDFNKIPELSDLELKSFKKIFYEYQLTKSHFRNKTDSGGPQRNLPSTEEYFASPVEILNGGCGYFSLGDDDDEEEEDEGEWEEESDGDYDGETSEMTGDMRDLMDDGFEDIDEDI